jgi:hypothetical protein
MNAMAISRRREMERSAGSAQSQHGMKHAGSRILRLSCRLILFHIDYELIKRTKRWRLKSTHSKKTIEITNNQLGREVWAPGIPLKETRPGL